MASVLPNNNLFIIKVAAAHMFINRNACLHRGSKIINYNKSITIFTRIPHTYISYPIMYCQGAERLMQTAIRTFL